jgi:hypothetical protein|tara:strand:- start:1809 stop:2561 length:753 start_codon:yes stop_codon:yes gene_type:complete
MAYSVRGKFSNQQKYSDRQFNQVLDLLTLKANESSILQEELQESVDRSAKAAKKGKTAGILGKILSFAIPGPIDDVIINAGVAAYNDRLRDKALDRSDIDMSRITYLNRAADEANRNAKQFAKDITKGMKFGDQIDTVAFSALNAVVQESEAFKTAKEGFKKEWDTMTFGEKLKPKNLLDMGKDYFDAYKSELGKIKKLGLEEYKAKDLLSLVDNVPIAESAYRNIFSGAPSIIDTNDLLKNFEVSEDGN